MAGITKWPFLGVIVLLAFAVTSSHTVIVITDLDFGRIPQPPRNTESDLVHVRVTSGRLGGRFFYRVSETGLPSDLPALMIPFGFFYQQTPYALLPRTDRPQQRLQPQHQPLLPLPPSVQAASAVPPHVRLQQRPLTLQPPQQHAVTSPFAATLASLAPLPIAAQHHQLSQQQQPQQTVTPPPVVTTTTDKSS